MGIVGDYHTEATQTESRNRSLASLGYTWVPAAGEHTHTLIHNTCMQETLTWRRGALPDLLTLLY